MFITRFFNDFVEAANAVTASCASRHLTSADCSKVLYPEAFRKGVPKTKTSGILQD